MSAMTWRGYMARIEFDEDDELFIGHIAGVKDIVGFHSDNVAGLKAAFREAVDDYLETCEKLGKTPEKPYSGKVMFRIAPELHARAALAAQMQGMSLNQWAEQAIRNAVG